MRSKTFIRVAPVALVIALAGCGGGSSSGGSSSGGSSAASKADVDRLLEQTFGANPKADSGQLNGRIDVHVKGVPAFRQPIAITMTGPFTTSSDGTPEADLTLGLAERGGELGGEMILKGGEVLIGLGSTGYEVPSSIASKIRRPLVNSDNSLGAITGVFGIAPRRWAKSPRIVGNENINGVDTIHGTAKLNTKALFLDLAKLIKTLTSLRITDITGWPKVIDRGAREALERSVKSATGDVYTGAKDHVMRRATLKLVLKPSARDSRRLAGITSVTVDGTLDVTDVGSKPKVSTPPTRGSYQQLQGALDTLAAAIHREIK